MEFRDMTSYTAMHFFMPLLQMLLCLSEFILQSSRQFIAIVFKLAPFQFMDCSGALWIAELFSSFGLSRSLEGKNIKTTGMFKTFTQF